MPVDNGLSYYEEGLENRIEGLEAALLECATIAGADVSGGVPSYPDVAVWAVEEVQALRDAYNECLEEMP